MRTGIGLWLVLAGCGSVDPRPPDWAANVGPAVVNEVERAGDRVLLHVVEEQWDFWASVPADVDAKVGDDVWLGKGRADRVGEREVIAIDQARVATAEELEAFEVLDPPEGGLSLAELYAARPALAGKPVAVRGRVVKASYDIFGTNWYHLRDGTGDEGTSELTVTAHQRFEVGAVVEARGKLTIDKDLGYGYFYAAIVEDAVVR